MFSKINKLTNINSTPKANTGNVLQKKIISKSDTFEKTTTHKKVSDVDNVVNFYKKVDFYRLCDTLLSENYWSNSMDFVSFVCANRDEDISFKCTFGIYNEDNDDFDMYSFDSSETKNILVKLYKAALKKHPDKKEALEQIHQQIIARIDGD